MDSNTSLTPLLLKPGEGASGGQPKQIFILELIETHIWPNSIHLNDLIEQKCIFNPPVTEAGGGGLRRAAKTNLNIGLK